MDSATRSLDLDTQKPIPKPFSFPNGTLKKHFPPPPPAAAAADDRHQYRECLRNHAASLGGHAVDGCCEFMPSPSADPAVPTSLTCAACGCHRNFHRRLPLDARLRHDDTDDDNDEESSEDEDGERRLRRRRRTSGSPPPYSSVPHMLLALSGAGAGARAGSGGPVSTQTMAAPITVSSVGFQAGAPPHSASGSMPRKRFRTKFSSEQKERMQEMSERLGWKMQKKDEAIVEEFCRQIGVERAVFKVWMHNNKHTYHGSPSSWRNEIGDSGSGGGGGGSGGGGGGGEGNGLGSGGDNSGGNNHAVNGSPPSS